MGPSTEPWGISLTARYEHQVRVTMLGYVSPNSPQTIKDTLVFANKTTDHLKRVFVWLDLKSSKQI